MATKKKPDCYKCTYRRDLAGDMHSSCSHPKAGGEKNPLANLMAIFASVDRINPTINIEGAKALDIQANSHGIRMGWFNWPYNFDPTWLMNCNGFTPKEVKE